MNWLIEVTTKQGVGTQELSLHNRVLMERLTAQAFHYQGMGSEYYCYCYNTEFIYLFIYVGTPL
jgi:hypothetical protein